MPTITGPCEQCQTVITKYVRPGRHMLCLDCAIAKMTDQQRRMAQGRHPDLHKSIAAGHAVGRQILDRQGPVYDKWKAGMERAAAKQTTTTGGKPATLPVDRQPARKGRPGGKP